jgi:hypothetical protein
MNILEIEDIIKGLPDQSLMQEAQAPSGQMPQFLVVSEIQRRADMRKRFQNQQKEMPQGTIARADSSKWYCIYGESAADTVYASTRYALTGNASYATAGKCHKECHSRECPCSSNPL